MKPTMARCVHGRVWFLPCEACDDAEAIWLSDLRHDEERRQRAWMWVSCLPPLGCRVLS